jgi:uncharacterized protein YjeT (DUF2065 family)
VRAIAASVLVFEGLVVFFATLVALDLSDLPDRTLWLVGSIGAVACLVVAGLLRHPWAFTVGSVLQVLLIGTGVVVPVMFFLGALFAGLWFLALFLGRRVQRLQAASRQQQGGR